MNIILNMFKKSGAWLLRIFGVCIFSSLFFLFGFAGSLKVIAQTDSVEQDKALMSRPNIIFILTDDMDNSLTQYMPKLKKYITDYGMTFNRFFVNEALCCPSRAAILKGQYAHNTKIFDNTYPMGGFSLFNELGSESSTVNVKLHRLGYKTVLIGKYLNGYPNQDNITYIPPGWSQWFVPTENAAYGNYNYKMNENGVIIQYGNSAEDYLTDVISRKALSLIDQSTIDKRPYFMFLSVYAPHGPATPAPRHEGLFADLRLPRSPSFNEANVNDKPSYIKQLPLIQNWVISSIMEPLYRNKARSLQAVDDMIEAIVKKLEQTGQLSRTYIFFTSDNGFHLGEHRMYKGKQIAYEEDIKVPLIIRGPRISSMSENNNITGNVDLAPTFVDLAYRGLGKGAYNPGSEMDGRSLVPLFSSSEVSWRKAYLIEYAEPIFASSSAYLIEDKETSLKAREVDADKEYDHVGDPVTIPSAVIPPYAGLRTNDFLYVEYSNTEKEFYNMRLDPYQLTNIAYGGGGDWVPSKMESLAQKLRSLAACKGDSCRSYDR